MNNNLLQISFATLLLASSAISGQTASDDDYNQARIMLATADVYTNSNADGKLEDIIVDQHSKAHKAVTDTAETVYIPEEKLVQLREIFTKAESTVKKTGETGYLEYAEKLEGYPLLPYLQYQWLTRHLDNEKQVTLFLEENESSRYAGKLKYRWLNHLGRHGQWPLFLQYYTQGNDDKLNCYYQRAVYNTGNKQAALSGARELWKVGRSQPSACDPLFAQLKKSDLFNNELLWERFSAAMGNNKTSLATYVKSLMSKSDQATAQLWINLHRKPEQYLPKLLKLEKNPHALAMFIHAVERLARNDIATAIDTWDENKQLFLGSDISNSSISAIDELERYLAFKLAYHGEPGAYERLSQLDNPDTSSKTWRVRAALTEQNWPNVITAINDLDEIEKNEERWQYWLARASLETGNVELAQNLLSALAVNRSFYGYLAADKVNSMYQLADNPLDIPEAQIRELTNRKEFLVAHELLMLDRENEAKLQWWHAVGQLDDSEIPVAAKLAQQWDWSDEIAIFTIAKVEYWDDIELRFPLTYADKVFQNSEQQKLDPSIVFGMIRRESAFNENAHSAVGARGLMQIMPRTGKHIAKNLKERWRGSNSLYNPATNLKYGSYYYQTLLDKFDGHYAIALAAYNAGPERVKQWLPENKTVPADVWIETIPFKETREYVSNVLAYTLIYQQRTQTDGQLSMNVLARDISPSVNN